MSRDSSRTHLHLHCAHHADLFEDFTRVPLAPDTIFLPPQHQPINPEDEDDVVPDQHAAFGIAKATRETREPVWRDLRLNELASEGAEGGRDGIAGASAGGEGAIAAAASVGGANGASRAAHEQQPAIGPARGVVGVPVSVRQGMRAIGANGSSLRG